MQEPLVSIAIYTYNQIDFIETTLKSALEQNYDNLEVVVADDGSTDGTREVIIEYSKKYPTRLIPVIDEPNLGVTGNCNRVLNACRGDYIAWLPGDDIFLPNKTRMQVEWFLNNPDGAICCCDSDVFDSDTGQTLMVYRNDNFYRGKSAWQIAGEFNAPPTCALMVNQRLCRDIRFDQRTSTISDWLYVVEVCMRGKIGYVDEALVRYRRHANNVTGGGAGKTYLDDRLIYTDLLISKYPGYFLPHKKQRGIVFYTTALREFLDGKYTDAKWKALYSIAEWPFMLRVYFLLIGCLMGKLGVEFAVNNKSRLNRIFKNH